MVAVRASGLGVSSASMAHRSPGRGCRESRPSRLRRRGCGRPQRVRRQRRGCGVRSATTAARPTRPGWTPRPGGRPGPRAGAPAVPATDGLARTAGPGRPGRRGSASTTPARAEPPGFGVSGGAPAGHDATQPVRLHVQAGSEQVIRCAYISPHSMSPAMSRPLTRTVPASDRWGSGAAAVAGVMAWCMTGPPLSPVRPVCGAMRDGLLDGILDCLVTGGARWGPGGSGVVGVRRAGCSSRAAARRPRVRRAAGRGRPLSSTVVHVAPRDGYRSGRSWCTAGLAGFGQRGAHSLSRG